MSRKSRTIWAWGVVGLILVVWYWSFTSHDVRYSALMSECRGRLKHARGVLSECIKQNHDLPRDQNGHFSPDAMICPAGSEDHEHCVPLDWTCCPLNGRTDPPWRGLIWFKDLSQEQMKQLDSPQWPPWILICHDADTLHYMHGKYLALLCFSNGMVIQLPVVKEEYRRWLNKDFLAGKLEAPEFVVEQLERDDLKKEFISN